MDSSLMPAIFLVLLDTISLESIVQLALQVATHVHQPQVLLVYPAFQPTGSSSMPVTNHVLLTTS